MRAACIRIVPGSMVPTLSLVAYSFLAVGGTTSVSGDIVALTAPNPTTSNQLGWRVAGISDIDGDGHGDVLVGAPFSEIGQGPNQGLVYVYSGRTQQLLRTHTSPSPEPNSGYGGALVSIGDLNNDGRDDYVVGAAQEAAFGEPNAGRVYIYSGFTGTIIRTIQNPNPSEYPLFGTAVATIPDLSGDNRPEIMVTAGSSGSANRVYIFNGFSGALIRSHLEPLPNWSTSSFGFTVSGIPDVNNDARGDYMISAPTGFGDANIVGAGRVYVYSGLTGTLLHVLTSPNEEANGYFGDAIVGLPDVGGNGFGDIIIAAPYEAVGPHPSAGRVYVFSGTSGTLSRTITSPDTGDPGSFGYSLAPAGDVDSDGRADVLIGALSEGDLPQDETGRVYVIAPDDGELLRWIEPEGGIDTVQYFGFSVAAVPDLNADGQVDYVVGAPFSNVGSGDDAEGKAFIVRHLDNDGCSPIPNGVTTLANGLNHVTTIGATGAASSGCGPLMTDDVWFVYTATCLGTLTISTCGINDFDSILSIYGSCAVSGPLQECVLGAPLACDDDGCGDIGGGATISVPTIPGQCFRVRLGGFNGDDGEGFLFVSCVANCPGDINQSGTVDAEDLAQLLGAWGTSALGPDINGNGVVDGQDLAILLGNWGPC